VGGLLLYLVWTSRLRLRLWSGLAGLLCVSAIGVAQTLHQPRTFAVDSSAGLTSRRAPRVVELHDGAFKIDLSETPVLGEVSATNVLVHLFDYTCPHCRRLHPVLKQLHQALSNRVAIASLLVPLATNCNRLLKRPIQEHLTACELAEAGLAIWRTEPDQLAAFEEWVFSSAKPPGPEAARTKGRELVGTNAYDRALSDPWIREHLARNITLYESNYVRFRKAVLPEVMVGTNILSGAVGKVEVLYRLLGMDAPAKSQ
jgi:thiol-disulfide isomerase/thioredoxin